MTEATEDARRIEKAAHALLDSHSAGGEWFNVAPDVAQKAVAKASQMIIGTVSWESVQHKPFTGRPAKESAMNASTFIGMRATAAMRAYLEKRAKSNGTTLATELRASVERDMDADRKRKGKP